MPPALIIRTILPSSGSRQLCQVGTPRSKPSPELSADNNGLLFTLWGGWADGHSHVCWSVAAAGWALHVVAHPPASETGLWTGVSGGVSRGRCQKLQYVVSTALSGAKAVADQTGIYGWGIDSIPSWGDWPMTCNGARGLDGKNLWPYFAVYMGLNLAQHHFSDSSI